MCKFLGIHFQYLDIDLKKLKKKRDDKAAADPEVKEAAQTEKPKRSFRLEPTEEEEEKQSALLAEQMQEWEAGDEAIIVKEGSPQFHEVVRIVDTNVNGMIKVLVAS